jgi:hypothetical protein
MPNPKMPDGVEPLTIEELESGLRVMKHADTDRGVFWDENVAAFRQTVILAIRETSDALLSPTVPPRWRAELEAQLEDLVAYMAMADRYIASRREFDNLVANYRRH